MTISEVEAAGPKSDVSSLKVLSQPKLGYLPTLDGWRAFAILAVIQFHDRVYKLGPVSSRFLHENGSLGVDFFFAISGFLICSKLLEEYRRRGSISLRSFYIRRCFRIMPAAWLYLIACVALSLCGIIPTDWSGLITSLLMLRNLWIAHAGDTPTHWYTIHFWSLSVEEHFYLLLPGVLVLAARKRQAVIGCIAILALLWSMCILRYHDLQSPAVWLRTDYRLSALIVPAFFAVLLEKNAVRLRVIRWLRPWVAYILLLVMYDLSHVIRIVSSLTFSVGFPLVVLSTVYHPTSLSGRFLELPLLRFFGRISYSLYLWQQLFFLMGHQHARWPFSIVQQSFLGYIAAFLLALLSYRFVERPFIRLGHKLAARAEVPFSDEGSRLNDVVTHQ